MADARGKRGKKSAWQVSLGVRELVFTGLGLAGLMMMSFALGALAGRGDIFVLAHRWGLMGPEAARVAQAPPLPAVPPQVAAVAPPAAVPVPPSGNPAPAAPAPAAAPPAKKPAAKSPLALQKQKEEELRRLREQLARNMKFQNSQEQSRATAKSGKGKGKERDKSMAQQSSPAPVTVARFRDKKAAQAKVAELQQQGQKVTLQEGRDQKGVYYAVMRSTPARDAGPSSASAKARQTAPAGQPKKTP
ncbi:MAG: hypothetical protein K6T55_09990 [Syntrophobacterales bacterium]|nr:hypothetical protein [Syntrophobacterales bacterium]